ncbi:MAG: hypothetical protein KGH94_01430 [Candidatus Micrarchaeota archaeon]|nr:hypothetical protein [Candidatus Micrarchaeota archaeon]
MDEYGRMVPHKHRRAKATHKLAMAGIVIVIILVAAFAYFFLGGPVNVSGPTKLSVSGQGTEFSLGGKSYVISLASYNGNTGTEYVYLSGVPVFLGPLLNVTLHQNSSVKVNYGGQYAIMQLALISGGASSAVVQVEPLSASLQVSPDYQYIGHQSVKLPGLQVTVTTTIAGSTTTVSSNSVSTSTVSSTTTVQAQQTNYTRQAIYTSVQNDQNYALMLNFSTLYNETSGCTAPQYNSSYLSKFGNAPVPPEDYANVSRETPHAITEEIVRNSATSYNLEFLTQIGDPTYNGQPALVIGLSVTSPGTSSALAIVESDSYQGIFQGQTHSSLASLYQQSKSVGNACAALVG